MEPENNSTDSPEPQTSSEQGSKSHHIIVFSDESQIPATNQPNSRSNAVFTTEVDSSPAPGQDGIELIQISSFNDLQNITGGHRVWQLIPSTLRLNGESVVVVDQPAIDGHSNQSQSLHGVAQVHVRPPPPDAPEWAKILNDCEKVGHYYRGWVATEQDLDIALTLHKQQTHSFWGTRQSPTCNRPSARMMWKSQYVPYDGIPFINCGSRAVVMECQFGPRRKGSKTDKTGTILTADFKQACPARIYIKKVRKFLEFAVSTNLDKKATKLAMDQSFAALRAHGFSAGGQDRFYLQLPTEKAHEYHTVELRPSLITKTFDLNATNMSGGNRLAEPVAAKIRELVASGIQHVTTVRKMLRKYVVKDLFNGDNVPVRHDLSFFPTVNDLQNHIHTALLDIENGTLPLQEATMDTLAIDREPEWGTSWGSNLQPHPETVTVTLTQGNGVDAHVISKVETHMSDGTIRVSTSLTAETASLLARLHPKMFPSIQDMVANDQPVDGEKITELVQSILTRSSKQETPVTCGDTHMATDIDIQPTEHNLVHENSHELPTEDVQLDLTLSESTSAVTSMYSLVQVVSSSAS